MFKKTKRFSFRTGVPKQKIISPFFVLRFSSSGNPTYAVVTSKAVSKKAVFRNKTKRLFLSVLKDKVTQCKDSHTLVFFLRLPYTEYTKSVIIHELDTVFQKINTNN